MKLRYWLLIAFLVILAVIVAGGAVLLETGAGLRWVAGVAVRHSGGSIRIAAAEGKLSGPLKLEGLRITLPGMRITARQLRLDWQPAGLFGGVLRIGELHAQGVRIVTLPGNAESSGLPEKLDLPLHIVVHEAQIRDLVAQAADEKLALKRLDFVLDASDASIRVTRLVAHGPRIAASGNLAVAPHGNWKIHAVLGSVLHPVDYPAVAGETRIDGALRGSVDLAQTLSKPFAARLHVRLSSLFARPRAEGRLQIPRVNPKALDSDLPDLTAGAALEFAGTVRRFRAQGRLRVEAPVAKTVNLALAAGLDGDELHVERLDLALAGRPERVVLAGKASLGSEPSANLHVAWQDLAWPLTGGEPTLRLPAGEAHVKGWIDSWTLAARTRLRLRDLPEGRWSIAATGNHETVAVSDLRGSWLGGSIEAKGTASLAGSRPFDLSARLRDVQLQTISKELNGRVGFDVAASGNLEPLAAAVEVSHFEGKLRGFPVTGEVKLAYADAAIRLDELRLAVGPNRLTASGIWNEKVALRWQLQAPKLAALGLGLAGRLGVGGSLEGSRSSPILQAHLDGENLKWKEVSVAKIEGEASLNLATRVPSALDLHLEALQTGDLAIERLDAMLAGPPSAQVFHVALLSSRGDLRLAGQGSLGRERWSGVLTEGSFEPRRGPRFDLAAPAALTLGRENLQLARSCWRGPQNSELCLEAASGSRGWNAAADIAALPLDLVQPWLGKDVTVAGELGGSFKAAGGAARLKVEGELRAGASSISRRFAGTVQTLAFSEISLAAQVDEKNAKAQLHANLSDGGMLALTADVPWRDHPTPAGSLHLVAKLPDLSGLGALSDALSDVRGQADADLRLSGSLDAPEFAGEVHLSGLGLTLTRFGTRVRNGELALTGEGAALAIGGHLEDGHGGRLGLHGSLERKANDWLLALQVTGKGFRAVDTPEMQVAVSPDLAIRMEGLEIALRGEVLVPSARISPPQLANAIAPTPDLVIIGEEESESEPAWLLSARLRVRLGENVRFSGFGLDARIGGAIRIHEEPEELTTASGELNILDGRYKAYGQDLRIERGRLLFSGGPVANPGLDIRATRRVATVTVGLAVTGTLRTPRLSVFSNPPMSQSNALAYLLFGHAAQQNNSTQNDALNQAANAIGLAGGTYIVKSIGKHVGLDTVSVENASQYSTDAKQASLFLGKYLSPRLYVSYGIGIYAPINLLRVRYTLSRHWALEAESGSISGADILFHIAH